MRPTRQPEERPGLEQACKSLPGGNTGRAVLRAPFR